MAARNVFSHLLDLHARNLVYCRDKLSPNAAFSLRMN
jgi:hypothetical protein